MITLRGDQFEAVENVRSSLREYQSVLLQAPTGFGKTIVAAYIASAAHKKRSRVVMGVHRRELARQTARTFDRFGIPYGFIAAGWPSNPYALVQIASVDTLRRRPQLMGCDLFVPDEAHLWTGETRLEVINTVKQDGAHIVALTATPEAPAGRSMRSIADHMVCGPSVSWLMDHGHLSRYIPYAAARPDLTKLAKVADEYSVPAMTNMFDKPAIIGNAVETYKRLAWKLRTIGFCFSRDRGKKMRDAFNAAGIPAGYIDGDTPDDERKRIIYLFATRVIWVLFNVFLVAEGFDMSSQVDMDVPIEAVILDAPTTSFPRAMQMIGRGLRPKDFACPILDHAGVMVNRDGTLNHGFPDDPREYSLDGPSKRSGSGEAAIPVSVCRECLASFTPRPACPYCGAVRQIDGREVEQLAGELAELDIEKVRLANIEAKRKAEFEAKERTRRTNAARTVKELVAVAKENGYKLPGFVAQKLKGRGVNVNSDVMRQIYQEMRS